MQSKCPLVNISKLSRIREKRDFGFGGPKKKKKKSEHTLGDAVCLSLVKEGTEGRRSGRRDTQPVSVCTEGDPSRDTHSPAETCREGPR